jgi:predicted translin family RNA/ssDNA-binding protein
MFSRLATSCITRKVFSGAGKQRSRALIFPPLAHLYLTVSTCVPFQAESFSTMPGPPYQYRSADSPVFDISSLGSQINEVEDKRQVAFDVSRKVHVQFVKTKSDMELSTATTAKTSETLLELCKSLQEATGSSDGSNNRTPREANLSNRVEEYVRILAFNHFLASGTLIDPSQCGEFVTDEEYLAGACMGLCQDLARYAIGRATARDLSSVKATRDLVQEVLDYLLKFDFRNGYLRRRYDGTKYALKTVETLLYELAVTGASDGEEPDSKRTKLMLCNQEELECIRKRMEHRDELREKIIKKSRDGQKAAKQAIYAIHRGDPDKAQRLLKQCEECITNDLLPIVDEEPPLRSGSCSNVLEEFAEAKLFYVWLLGKEDKPSDKCSGILLMPDEFGIDLSPEEYLGGLCDLTGEIGRYAVQRGTARDFDGVKMCLEANSAILVAMQTLGRLPGGIGKKMDQLRRSVEKLERMTYELSLSEATGRKIQSEAIEATNPSQEE